MQGLVAIDGVVVPRGEAKIGVYDRGFLYGDSVFETMRTYEGRLYRLADHMARLGRSLGVVRIEPPMSPEALGLEITGLVARAREELTLGGDVPEIVARVMVTRGESPLGLLPQASARGTRVLFLERVVMPPARLYEEGASVVMVPTYRPSDAARGAKVGNYLESILALQRGKEQGADEALIVDAGGFVVEGTTSNVFIVKDGRLLTPPVSSSLLPGITRRTVIELASELGIPFEERSLVPADLTGADEAFITSTVRGVMPLGAIDGHALGRERPVTASLRAAFATRVLRS